MELSDRSLKTTMIHMLRALTEKIGSIPCKLRLEILRTEMLEINDTVTEMKKVL